MTAPQNPLMTMEEVAAAFGVSLSTVKRWLRAGTFTKVTRPPQPLPQCYRAEVEAMLIGRPLTREQVAELRDQLSGQVRQP